MTLDVTVEYNFQPFKQGTDWSRSVVFTSAGVAIPLTDYTAAMTIRDEPHMGGVSLLALSTTPTANGSVLTITPTSGMVTIYISDADSDAFTWTTGYYDLKLIGPVAGGSLESVPLYGKITVIQKVTP